jgi:hypothetical protein
MAWGRANSAYAMTISPGLQHALDNTTLSPVVWKSQHAIIHANYWRAQIEEENRWQRKISL